MRRRVAGALYAAFAAFALVACMLDEGSLARTTEKEPGAVRLRVDGLEVVGGGEVGVIGRGLPLRCALDEASQFMLPSGLKDSDVSGVEVRSRGVQEFIAMIADVRVPPAANDTPAWRLRRSPVVAATVRTESVNGSRTWVVEWRTGVRAVPVRAFDGSGGPVPQFRVISLDTWEEVETAADGAAYLVVAPRRAEGAVVVMRGRDPVPVDGAVISGSREGVTVSGDPRVTGRSLRVRWSWPQGQRPTRLTAVSGWAWDCATGALLEAVRLPGDAPSAVFQEVGGAPVEIVVQVADEQGHTWSATWSERDAAVVEPQLLQPTLVRYVRWSRSPGVVLRGQGLDGLSATVRRAAEVSGTALVAQEHFVWAAPGLYEVGSFRDNGGRAREQSPVSVRIRQGVLAEVLVSAP